MSLSSLRNRIVTIFNQNCPLKIQWRPRTGLSHMDASVIKLSWPSSSIKGPQVEIEYPSKSGVTFSLSEFTSYFQVLSNCQKERIRKLSPWTDLMFPELYLIPLGILFPRSVRYCHHVKSWKQLLRNWIDSSSCAFFHVLSPLSSPSLCSPPPIETEEPILTPVQKKRKLHSLLLL